MKQNLTQIPITELREQWSEAWSLTPHARIGRTMLERSLNFKLKQSECDDYFSEQQKYLDNLIKAYKRNTASAEPVSLLKPGTQLVRTHQGKKHSVIVRSDGFDYNGQVYKSLSTIANEITGKHWNGWVFFGLKKPVGKS